MSTLTFQHFFFIYYQGNHNRPFRKLYGFTTYNMVNFRQGF